ncbi:NADPH:quinone reductase [Halalkalibacter nanhaiisediminis]|uniref:NADPH2:quinone reductase n=1 Tax=Halalkalibacter nanhaiisediminis TaxID=688079 RepID=A0A562Q838_9BACI|nr:NADPH:quinone reductase [Halalkalibacter nanhaiisediminis]TWI52878.1 NADPH2:quinone reductase [Halalkalibacter nanhaiisediminis]
MKAVVYEQYGDPAVLKVSEVEKPTIKPNQVLIKVKASGINPVDTYFRKGIRQVDSFPYIPHFDVSGVVSEVGSEVENIKIGDHVWATNAKGASAEYVAVASNFVFPLHADLPYADGAALAMPFMTAHLALHFKGNLQENESVLIFGAAGAVGHAAVQLAKQAGAHVIATAGNAEKAEIARKAGADHVIMYKEEDIVARAMELTNNEGIDLILDMSLSENIEKDLEMVTVGGRIVTIGSPVNNTPTLPWRQLNMKNASLLGILLFTAPLKELTRAGKEISESFSNGMLTAHIGKIFPYTEAASAHQLLEQKEVNGRIILNHEE